MNTRRLLQPLAFLLASAACIIAGRLLSHRADGHFLSTLRRHPEPGEDLTVEASKDGPGRQRPGSAGEVPLPQTRAEILQRLLAKASTAQLWEWLSAEMLQQQTSMVGPIVQELVDRLGWRAWDTAMRLEDKNAKGLITDAVLGHLAAKDPWKAYEIWKQVRADFYPGWGSDVSSQALQASAQTSAATMVEILRSSEKSETNYGIDQEFAPGFDFRTVADYLNGSTKSPDVLPYNLMSAWAAASPQQAAQWLLDHPEYVKRAEELNLSPVSMVKDIAALPEGSPGRAEALALLAQMPGDYIESAWKTSAQGFSDGKYSPDMRAAAAAMGQEDAWLPATLAQTQFKDELDPSWQQVPVAERAVLLEKAEALLPPADKLTPLELRSRTRWLQMVKKGWGLGE